MIKSRPETELWKLGQKHAQEHSLKDDKLAKHEDYLAAYNIEEAEILRYYLE